jgi:hypothetical protein
MRAIKGFILFCFLTSMFSACFDAPEFDVTPEISFNKIDFRETPSAGDYDTLVLYINFKDGDGDLGLDDNYLDEPFNSAFYYLAAGPQLKDTVKATTTVVYENNPPYNAFFLLLSNGKGPLVTNRTRSTPGFESLPIYDQNSCLNYSYTEVLVPASLNAVDATYNITDTLNDQTGNDYYLIEEALYYKSNVYHNNIEVKFWVLENGIYKEFDWYEKFCISFNGRFPVLGDEERPLEGTIRYAMANPGFISLFSVKTIRISVRIRDRALHTSKEIFTPPFTLSSI